MKKLLVLAALGAVLSAWSSFAMAATPARIFTCKELADNARDHEITLKLGSAKASLINFMGDGRGDEGKLKSSKVSGDTIYQGFPHWVDTGVADSGYLFVPAKLLKDGKGIAQLHSRACKENGCADRKTRLSCSTF